MACGEPVLTVSVTWPPELDDPSPEEAQRWIAENARAQHDARKITEARALEYAGDVESAIAIYEELVASGNQYGIPHKRLAIIYGKLKRRADEERIVRAALAVTGGGASSWFVLRLAKILARKKKEEPHSGGR